METAPDTFMYAVAFFAGILSFIIFNCLPYLSREALGIRMGNPAVVVSMVACYVPFYFWAHAYLLPEYTAVFPTMIIIFVGVSGFLELGMCIFMAVVDENGQTRRTRRTT